MKCRLPLDLNRSAKDYEVIVFTSTFEEANCNFGNCLFTFIAAADLPEVVTFEKYYDFDLEKYFLTVIGTGFTDTPDQIEFLLDGAPQSVIEANSTAVVVEVTNVPRSGFIQN